VRAQTRELLNKVPEITLYFWVIKVLCTTVGETASDYLTDNVGLGLTKTTFITGALLAAVLVAQFRTRRYVPPVYWLAVVLISVVGTQITDNLVDNYGVALETTTTVFSIALAAVFVAWYASEKTLSIHTIFTTRREGFYWLAVLFTFALGTAAGDLAAERLSLGYAVSVLIFGGLIGTVAVAHYRFALNAVAAFWIAYILTRPLGASLGDYLSQPRSDGGLGLGTTVTSAIFLATIALVVAFLTLTRRDVTEDVPIEDTPLARILVVLDSVPATAALLDAVHGRAARGPASFHLLVHRPGEHAEITDAERRRNRAEAERALATALPVLGKAAGAEPQGSVSTRHDPMDAIEETVARGRFDELIVAAAPHRVSRWLRIDLFDRLAHLGLPVTTVVGHAPEVAANATS
jgi:uncharacterized membrane-anchored protein